MIGWAVVTEVNETFFPGFGFFPFIVFNCFFRNLVNEFFREKL